MKKLILTSMLAIAGMQMIGQPKTQTATNPFKISYGENFEFPKKYADYGFFGNLEDGFVQLSYKYQDEIQLTKFDKQLRVSKTSKFDLSKMPGSTMPENCVQIGDKYYWMFSSWDKKEEKEHLSAKEINIKDCAITDRDIPMIETTKLVGTQIQVGMYHFEVANKYDFYYSDDDNLFLVTYMKEKKFKDDSKNKDVIGLNMFDKNMKKLWNKDLEMPYFEELMDIEDYYIDNTGNVGMLVKVYEGSRKKQKNKDDMPNYHYEVFKVTDEGKKMVPVKINLDGKFINQIYVYQNPQKEVIVAGYYSNDNKGSCDGLFMTKIDDANNINKVNHGIYEIPKEVLTMYMTQGDIDKINKKEEKGKDAEVRSLEMRKLWFNSDGSITAIGEQHWKVTSTYISGGQTHTTTTFYHNAIYVMKIGADGKMLWTKKIPKNQMGSVIYGTMGFSAFNFDDGMYFFYMDNDKNLQLNPVMKVEKHLDGVGGILMFTKIDKDGNMSKGKILDARVEDVRCMPAAFDKMGDNILIGRVLGDHKQSRILKLTK